MHRTIYIVDLIALHSVRWCYHPSFTPRHHPPRPVYDQGHLAPNDPSNMGGLPFLYIHQALYCRSPILFPITLPQSRPFPYLLEVHIYFHLQQAFLRIQEHSPIGDRSRPLNQERHCPSPLASHATQSYSSCFLSFFFLFDDVVSYVRSRSEKSYCHLVCKPLLKISSWLGRKRRANSER